MKKNLLILLISGFSILLPGNSQAQISLISQLPGRPLTSTIYQASGTAFANFPRAYSMEVLNGSSIVKGIVLPYAINADGSPSANAQFRSLDGGLTFTATSSTNAPTSVGGSMIKLRNGNLLAVPFSDPSPIQTHISTNNGASWTAQTGVGQAVQVHRSILQEDDGTLYATGYTASDIKIIKSVNNGKDWTLLSTLAMNGGIDGDGNAYSEPAMERCADGSWLLVARTESNSLRYVRSTNNGLNWTTPAALTNIPLGTGYLVQVDPHLKLMPNGILALSYTSRKNAPLDWSYGDNSCAFSYDNGVTWHFGITTFTSVNTLGPPGGKSSGYTAVVPINAHRMMQVGDTGTTWTYGTVNPSPNPYSIWGKFIDIVRTQQNRIDLKAKYGLGAVTIVSPATTLTYTDAVHPEARTSGVFDGSTDYWSGALGTTSGVYQLDLQKTYTIQTIGAALLYGKAESATIELSPDGSTWTTVKTYTNATHYCLNYTNITPFSARYVRVTVSGTGQVGLAELELYEASSTFENNSVSLTNDPHGILPTGYVANGSTATEYGFSVQEGVGYQSNRALKMWDGSSGWIAGIKKIVSASNKKTLEFRCRIANLPTTGSFSIPIVGTVSGVENIVFRVAVFGSTSTQGVVKYYNSTSASWVQIGTATLPISGTVWKLVKIAADESANTASLYIDNVLMGSFPMTANTTSATNLTGFGLYSNGTATFGEVIYFDDVNFYDPTVSGPSGIAQVVSENILMPNFAVNSVSDRTDIVTNKRFTISVSPNPARNVVKLKFQNSSNGVVALHFTDMSGRVVKNLKYNLEAETSLLEIPIGDLLPGIYIIQAKQNYKIGITKLIVNEIMDNTIH